MNCICSISAQKSNEKMMPAKIEIPPNIGTSPLCDERSPALSYKRNFCAKNMIFGIAKNVITNAVTNEKRIFKGIPNIFYLFELFFNTIISD